jgi:putative ABC transport system permease protein
MRTADLLRFAFAALWRHKVRTLLTLSGVTAGAFLLVVSISVGRGVEDATLRQLRKSDQLRKITVFPSFQATEASIPSFELVVKGEMSEARRQRLRRGIVRHWPKSKNGGGPTQPLDEKNLGVLRRMAHVESAVPTLQYTCRVAWNNQVRDVLLAAHEAGEDRLEKRLVAGTMLPREGKEVLVHEYLLYQWGITRDEDVAAVVGKKIRIEYRSRGPVLAPSLRVMGGGGPPLTPAERDLLERALARLAAAVDVIDLSEAQKTLLKKVLGADLTGRRPPPVIVFSEEFTVAGVVREWEESDKSGTFFIRDFLLRDTELFLPSQTAEGLFSRDPRHARHGFSQVTVTVDREESLKEVNDAITAQGFRCYSLSEIFERVRKNIILLSVSSAFLAAMALVVASVGIINMMLMSVLERTREIGLMKAVGAKDRQILFLFLFEGVVLGAVGGLAGLLLGWLASFPGDRIARTMVEAELGAPLDSSVFLYPLWLVVGVPLFALAITTLSAIYPAVRAARVSPIQALRHE